MHLVPRADPNCVKCGSIPACPACVTGEICQISGQSCNQCPIASCVPAPSTGGPPPSNPGTIAGTVVGVLALVGVAVGLFMFYRKRRAAALARERDEPKPVPDVPASASDVLSRPDPIEKPPSTTNTILPTTAAVTATNTNFSYPMSQYIADPNPFADQASINTASERSQNVIPIAYIPPPSPTQRNTNRDSDLSSTPSRPQRDPSMNLHLGTSNAQENARSSLLPPKSPLKYEPSQRSGVSGVSSRASYMSSASSAIDFVNDAPQIITPVHGHVRQVVGVVRAEVVQLPSTPSTPGGLHPRLQRPMNAGPSPLARSFASDSAGAVDDQSSLDPFADSHSRHDSQASFAHSFSSTSTFGTPRNRSAAGDESAAEWSPAKPQFNFAGARPDSVGSAITADISSAKVVTLGRQSSVLHRTLADYTTPVPTPAAPNFKHLTAMTESSEFDPSRGSLASSMNRVSTTDSILEAFPFVPPEAGAGGHGQLPPSPLSPSHPGLAAANSKNGNQTFPTNPSRHTLGLSTVSSASSSALDGYTFQFSSGDLSLMPPLPSAALTDRGSTSGISMNSSLGVSEGSLADASSIIFTPTESEFTPTAKAFPRPGGNGHGAGGSGGAGAPPSAFTMPSVTALGSGDATMRDSHASLDTLALSRELEAFPLTFDGPATPLSGSPGMSVPLPRADTFGNGTGAGKK